MAGLRQVRSALLLSHSQNLMNDEEFVLLYNLNSSKNQRFDIENFTDDECKAEFRFYKNDIYFIQEVLQIPDEIIFSNRLVVSGVEATCILLKRYSYPIRLGDMVPRFGRSVPQLSMIASEMTSLIYNMYDHKLTTFQQPWLAPVELERFAQTVHNVGAPLTNCWGFVDGTVRPICRPGEMKRTVYNGHKRVHAIKFQSIVAPNGLVANLYGPVEGKRHDSGMLADSAILPLLQQFFINQNEATLCVYGDLAYPLRLQLQTPFRNAQVNPQQTAYNTRMSKARIGVECVFGDITNLKLGLSPTGKMYLVCAFLMNIRTCMYHSMSSSYFNIDPPTVQEYLA